MKKRGKRKWSVYVLKCADGTFYTGIAVDVKARLKKHNTGLGAKYIISSRRPAKLVYSEKGYSRSRALKREYGIKKLKRKEKAALVFGIDNHLKPQKSPDKSSRHTGRYESGNYIKGSKEQKWKIRKK